MTKSIGKSDLFKREGMNDTRTRDNKSVASNTTATTNSTMSTAHSEATSKSHRESKSSKKEKKQDKDKEKKSKSSSEPKEKKSSKDKEKKKSKSEKSSKNKEGKKKNSSPSPTELEPTLDGKKNGIASFDAFDSFGFGDTNAFGENPAGENGTSSSSPRKVRSRRRASVSGGDARSCHSRSDDGFASASEDEIASFDGTSLRDTRTVPIPCHSSGSLDSPTAASKAKPRRRARRSSAVGNVSSSNSSFANSSFGQGSGASLDYGYEDHTTAKTGNTTAAEQYGYEDPSATSNGFGSDFGNFGAGPGGGRRQATRRYSVGGGMGGGSDHGSKDGIVVEDVGEHQRKLIDDIAFGSGFDSNGGGGGGGSSGGNNFMVPMADTAPQDNAGQNQRRPRRRTSLTLGGSFANHQVLDVDTVEAEKKQNKTGFFKDRSADRQKLSKNGAESTRAKNNENLTGYDFNRDRRRFMG